MQDITVVAKGLAPFHCFVNKKLRVEGEQNEITSSLMLYDRYAWVASGSTLAVMETRTGHFKSNFTFGDPHYQPKTQYIACVEQFPVDKYHLPFLIVGSNTTQEGYISVVNPISGMVRRKVKLKSQISCLNIIDDGVSEKSPFPQFLSGVMYGVLAVGCVDSSVILIDLRRDLFLNDKKPMFPDTEANNLVYIQNTNNKDEVREKFNICSHSEDSLAILMIEGKSEDLGVTALYYSKETYSLFVGFGTGAWEMWNINNFSLLYTAPESEYPVYGFSQLEPCDDPKYVLYMWVTYQSVNGKIPCMSLHSIAFDKKGEDANYGRYYRDFKSVTLAFEYYPDSLLGGAEKSRLVSSCSLVRNNQYQFVRGMRKDSDPHTLAFTSMWVARKNLNATYLLVFDLDQWYKSQMPSSSVSGSCQYLEIVAVTKRLVDGLHIVPSSLKTWTGSHEVFFYPQSLNFDIVCIHESSFITLGKQSLQSAWRDYVRTIGLVSLVHPQKACATAVEAGLIPNFIDDFNISQSSEEEMRLFMLSALFEYGMSDLIVNAVERWFDGHRSFQSCSLEVIINWLTNNVTKIWEKSSLLCARLYNHSGDSIESINLDNLYYFKSKLFYFHLLYSEIVHKYIMYIPLGPAHSNAMKLMTFYLDYVCKFAVQNLLPEKNAENLPISTIEYDYKMLWHNVEGLKPSLSLIYFLLGEHQRKILVQWNDEGGTLSYPPPSIQTLLRICLMDGLPENIVIRIFHYFILDLIDQHSTKGQLNNVHLLEKFEIYEFKNTKEYYLVKGLWLLDHSFYEESLENLTNPLALLCAIPPELILAVLVRFIVGDKDKLAYSYVVVVKPNFDQLDSAQLHYSLILLHGLPMDAYAYTKHSRLFRRELFMDFLFGCCFSVPLRSYFLKLINDENEKKWCEEFFRKSNFLEAKKFHVLHLISQRRYLEAELVQKHCDTDESSDGVGAKLVQGLVSTMSAFEKEQERVKMLNDQELSLNLIAQAPPRPLTAYIAEGEILPNSNTRNLLVACKALAWRMKQQSTMKSNEERNEEPVPINIPQSEGTLGEDSLTSESSKPASEDSNSLNITQKEKSSLPDVDITPKSRLKENPLHHSLKRLPIRHQSMLNTKKRRIEVDTDINPPSTPTHKAPPTLISTPLVQHSKENLIQANTPTHSILKPSSSAASPYQSTPKKAIRFSVPDTTSTSDSTSAESTANHQLIKFYWDKTSKENKSAREEKAIDHSHEKKINEEKEVEERNDDERKDEERRDEERRDEERRDEERRDEDQFPRQNTETKAVETADDDSDTIFIGDDSDEEEPMEIEATYNPLVYQDPEQLFDPISPSASDSDSEELNKAPENHDLIGLQLRREDIDQDSLTCTTQSSSESLLETFNINDQVVIDDDSDEVIDEPSNDYRGAYHSLNFREPLSLGPNAFANNDDQDDEDEQWNRLNSSPILSDSEVSSEKTISSGSNSEASSSVNFYQPHHSRQQVGHSSGSINQTRSSQRPLLAVEDRSPIPNTDSEDSAETSHIRNLIAEYNSNPVRTSLVPKRDYSKKRVREESDSEGSEKSSSLNSRSDSDIYPGVAHTSRSSRRFKLTTEEIDYMERDPEPSDFDESEESVDNAVYPESESKKLHPTPNDNKVVICLSDDSDTPTEPLDDINPFSDSDSATSRQDQELEEPFGADDLYGDLDFNPSDSQDSIKSIHSGSGSSSGSGSVSGRGPKTENKTNLDFNRADSQDSSKSIPHSSSSSSSGHSPKAEVKKDLGFNRADSQDSTKSITHSSTSSSSNSGRIPKAEVKKDLTLSLADSQDSTKSVPQSSSSSSSGRSPKAEIKKDLDFDPSDSQDSAKSIGSDSNSGFESARPKAEVEKVYVSDDSDEEQAKSDFQNNAHEETFEIPINVFRPTLNYDLEESSRLDSREVGHGSGSLGTAMSAPPLLEVFQNKNVSKQKVQRRFSNNDAMVSEKEPSRRFSCDDEVFRERGTSNQSLLHPVAEEEAQETTSQKSSSFVESRMDIPFTTAEADIACDYAYEQEEFEYAEVDFRTQVSRPVEEEEEEEKHDYDASTNADIGHTNVITQEDPIDQGSHVAKKDDQEETNMLPAKDISVSVVTAISVANITEDPIDQDPSVEQEQKEENLLQTKETSDKVSTAINDAHIEEDPIDQGSHVEQELTKETDTLPAKDTSTNVDTAVNNDVHMDEDPIDQDLHIEEELEIQKVEEELKIQNVEEELEIQNVEEELEIQNVEEELKIQNVEEELEIQNVEEELEIQNVEEELEIQNVEELEIQNVEEEPEIQNVEEELEIQNIEEQLEIQNVEEELEIQKDMVPKKDTSSSNSVDTAVNNDVRMDEDPINQDLHVEQELNIQKDTLPTKDTSSSVDTPLNNDVHMDEDLIDQDLHVEEELEIQKNMVPTKDTSSSTSVDSEVNNDVPMNEDPIDQGLHVEQKQIEEGKDTLPKETSAGVDSAVNYNLHVEKEEHKTPTKETSSDISEETHDVVTVELEDTIKRKGRRAMTKSTPKKKVVSKDVTPKVTIDDVDKANTSPKPEITPAKSIVKRTYKKTPGRVLKFKNRENTSTIDISPSTADDLNRGPQVSTSRPISPLRTRSHRKRKLELQQSGILMDSDFDVSIASSDVMETAMIMDDIKEDSHLVDTPEVMETAMIMDDIKEDSHFVDTPILASNNKKINKMKKTTTRKITRKDTSEMDSIASSTKTKRRSIRSASAEPVDLNRKLTSAQTNEKTSKDITRKNETKTKRRTIKSVSEEPEDLHSKFSSIQITEKTRRKRSTSESTSKSRTSKSASVEPEDLHYNLKRRTVKSASVEPEDLHYNLKRRTVKSTSVEPEDLHYNLKRRTEKSDSVEPEDLSKITIKHKYKSRSSSAVDSMQSNSPFHLRRQTSSQASEDDEVFPEFVGASSFKASCFKKLNFTGSEEELPSPPKKSLTKSRSSSDLVSNPSSPSRSRLRVRSNSMTSIGSKPKTKPKSRIKSMKLDDIQEEQEECSDDDRMEMNIKTKVKNPSWHQMKLSHMAVGKRLPSLIDELVASQSTQGRVLRSGKICTPSQSSNESVKSNLPRRTLLMNEIIESEEDDDPIFTPFRKPRKK